MNNAVSESGNERISEYRAQESFVTASIFLIVPYN